MTTESICARCRSPLDKPRSFVVEVREAGAIRHRTELFGLHPSCGKQWAELEVRRLAKRYKNRPDTEVRWGSVT